MSDSIVPKCLVIVTLTKQEQLIDEAGQAGAEATPPNGVALPSIEITYEMICTGAEILAASPFCGTSPGLAEDLVEEILRACLNQAQTQR